MKAALLDLQQPPWGRSSWTHLGRGVRAPAAGAGALTQNPVQSLPGPGFTSVRSRAGLGAPRASPAVPRPLSYQCLDRPCEN